MAAVGACAACTVAVRGAGEKRHSSVLTPSYRRSTTAESSKISESVTSSYDLSGARKHATKSAPQSEVASLAESPGASPAPFYKNLDAMEESTAMDDIFLGSYQWQKWLWLMLRSRYFDVVMGFIIASNSVNIGVEQSLRLHEQDTTVPQALEHFFLVVYILEFASRAAVFGAGCLKDSWVKFDLFLITSGALITWVLEPLLGSSNSFGPIMTLRMCRLLRLSRMLRLLGRFQVLWMMIQGLMKSINTMAYTLFLLTIMFYIFAIVTLEVISQNELVIGDNVEDEVRDVVDRNFGSLPAAMLTMLQFVTFDNVVLVYRPLVEQDWTLILLFVVILLIVGIVLMNLVTAVIVQGALDQAMQDQELQTAIEQGRRKKLAKDMRMIFLRLDKDGSGEVSREEIGQIEEDDKAVLKSLMDTSDPLEIFDALDVDGSGDLRIDEFVDGIWEVVVSNTPLHVKRMQRQIEIVFAEVRQLSVLQQRVLETVGKMAAAHHGKATESEALGPVTVSQPLSLAQDQLSRNSSPDSVPHLSMPPRKSRPGEALPAWAEDFVADMQQSCTAAMHRAVGEHCRSLLRTRLTPRATGPLATSNSPRPGTPWSDLGDVATHMLPRSHTCEVQKPGRIDHLKLASGQAADLLSPGALEREDSVLQPSSDKYATKDYPGLCCIESRYRLSNWYGAVAKGLDCACKPVC